MDGRFASNSASGRFGGAQARSSNRGDRAPQQRFGNPGFEQRGSMGNHSVFGGRMLMARWTVVLPLIVPPGGSAALRLGARTAGIARLSSALEIRVLNSVARWAITVFSAAVC